jgi:hypothetical protein
MTTIKSFVNRLAKIGIKVELFGNYPWIYLDTVNGKKVKDKFQGDHGFTVFFYGEDELTSIPIVFKKIREMLDSSYDQQKK